MPEYVRAEVLAFLKESRLFESVLTPEEAAPRDDAARLELTATLVEFKGGNAAARMLVGMGAGRASATFDMSLIDAATGKTIWQGKIKKTASFFANTSSSAAQRGELPEGLAKELVAQLKKLK